MIEKRVLYPVKIVNVSVEMPEPYQVEKQVSYEVKIDNSISYKIEMLILQPIEKGIPIKVKVPISQSYIDKPVSRGQSTNQDTDLIQGREKNIPTGKSCRSYQISVPKPYLVRIKVPVEKPYLMPVERPVLISVKVPDSQSKPVLVEIRKSYSVPIKVPMDKLYKMYETKPVLVPMEKPFSCTVQVPVSPSNLVGRSRT